MSMYVSSTADNFNITMAQIDWHGMPKVYPLGPPEDDLMVSYTSVPQDVLTEYLQTGVVGHQVPLAWDSVH